MIKPTIVCRPEYYEILKKKFSQHISKDIHYLQEWDIITNANLPIEYDLPKHRFIEYEEKDRGWLGRLGMLVPKVTYYVVDMARVRNFDFPIQIPKGLIKNYS